MTSDEIQRIEFVESVKRFEGLFVEGAIAGRWRNVDSKIHGRLCLYHISESSPAKIFRPGRWVGCYWNDTEGLWEQVRSLCMTSGELEIIFSFRLPFLGWIYGKSTYTARMTKPMIMFSKRLEVGRIKICVQPPL